MKTAILGTWHVHAPGYAAEALKLSEVIGVWEDNAEWRHTFALENGIAEFSGMEELLNSDADAVIVCTSTDLHADCIVRLAEHGKDIFTEKVLALTEEDCLRVKKAVEENGVRFVISYPFKANPGPRTLKRLVDEGAIGQVNYFRCRNCHNGSTGHWLPAHFYNAKQCGGGAMIDLGAHGMYLTRWFLGEPVSYASQFTHFCRDEKDAVLNPDRLEDNAVTVMGFADGAIGVCETGFVTVNAPMMIEVGGTLGYLSWQQGGKIRLAAGEREEFLDADAACDLPITAFLKGLQPEGCGIDDAIALTRMMIGAYAAAK